ncbi:SDR family oxidoreductase [Streptomyces sp. PU-14G]|uniref:SDR family oxidoreductase n=1 Tax=Streptomyces sp. PU-14G TaxID=2800808 RepID=UPI0034DFE3D9
MTRRIAVSGAASGIGKSLAGLLRAHGDDVVGIDLKDAEVCADLGTAAGRSEAVDGVLARTGGALDAVVACAGISAARPATVAVNFFGVTELLAGLRPALATSTTPRAAFVGSIAGTRATVPEVVDACLSGRETAALGAADAAAARGEGNKIYPSSKAALARWMRGVCLTGDWAAAGIPLNAVAPGVVLTPMHAAHAMTEEQRENVDKAVPMPLGGYAEPEVIAHALRWLVGVENTHMTGQVMYVDGGAEAALRGRERF